MKRNPIPSKFIDPPHGFSLLPFWFWNDTLTEDEIIRQMDDFVAHGVYGFVIHPRVGLPRDTGWMSPRMLHFVKFAVTQARRRRLSVVLYDEGMYPSGSSCGQVVAENPDYACRGLAKSELPDECPPRLPPGHELLAICRRHNGKYLAIINRPVNAVIRGLHYVGEGPEEDLPPAGDILNPAAVACFLRLVYDRYAKTVGRHFGKTVLGIFTDEPNVLGRCNEPDEVRPGTRDILLHVNRILGYDFTPHLPCLWFDDEPDALRYRADYHRAIQQRLEETYYQQLQRWADKHHIALMGHPAEPDDLGLERYLSIPGQDLVWRKVMPDDPSMLEGPESTQAKCSSSAMIHLGRQRNSNECFGAYGHELTFAQSKALIDWCLVRGVNMFFPHAFYYSTCGPRRDERPPDVGPNSAWWADYKGFADYCRRLCWLNTDAQHVCQLAILGQSNHLPWSAAKICFQRQWDFNYLEMRCLWEDARVSSKGIHLAEIHYEMLIIESPMALPPAAKPALAKLARAGRLLIWAPTGRRIPIPGARHCRTANSLITSISRLLPQDLIVQPHHPDVRYRHLIKNDNHYYLLSNEGPHTIRITVITHVGRQGWWFNPWTVQTTLAEDQPITLSPHETRVFMASTSAS